MQRQNCPNCGFEYNYFDKTATIICDRNHVVCKSCAIVFNKTRPQCPYCFPMAGFQNQQNLYNGLQPQIVNKPEYWQPNAGQNLNTNAQSFPQNQGFQQPQLIYPMIQRSNNANIFLGLSIFFFVVFFATFVTMVVLNFYQMASMPFTTFLLAIVFLVKYKKEKKNQEIQFTLANNQQGPYQVVQGVQGAQVQEAQGIGNNYVRI